MATWIERRFHDSAHAQKSLLGFALALGVIGILIVIGACWVFDQFGPHVLGLSWPGMEALEVDALTRGHIELLACATNWRTYAVQS